MLLDWMDKMMITMLDIGVLCNPDKTTIVSHNHKMDGPELEHWDQSWALQEFKRILPVLASLSQPRAQTMFFCRALPGGADQRVRRERALCGAQWRGEK